MLDLLSIDARIEPGAIIRDRVSIGKNEMCIRDRFLTMLMVHLSLNQYNLRMLQ